MTVIKDGAGSGNLAEVDSQNRLHVSAVTIPEAAHASVHDQLAFSIIGTTLITAAEKTILALINNTTSAKTIAIDSLRIGLQGETGKPATFRMYLGRRIYTAGGSPVTPVNLNATSTLTLDTTTVQDNPTLGGLDSQAQQSFLEATGTFDTEFNGEIVLPPGGSIRVTVQGDPAASGTKTALARFLYFALAEELHMS